MRTNEVVRPLLILLVEHVALFHESSVALGNTRLLHNASVLEASGHSNGNPEKEEEIQRNESSKVNGARYNWHAATSAEDSDAQGIAKRLEAQTNAWEIAVGRVNLGPGRSADSLKLIQHPDV